MLSRDFANAEMPLLTGTIAAGALAYFAVVMSSRLLGVADFGLLGTLLGITSVGAIALRPLHSATTHAAADAYALRNRAAVRSLAGRLLATCLAGALTTAIVLSVL